MKDMELGEGEEREIGETSASRGQSSSDDGRGKSCDRDHEIEVEISNSDAAQDSPTEKKLNLVTSQPVESENHTTGTSSDSENGCILISITEIKKTYAKGESCEEQCRICQDLLEETLMDLGCGCRGELAKAHRSCIERWFDSKGSNKCEICQQIAVNIPSPKSHASKNYWIWRVDRGHAGSEPRNPGNERSGDCPMWFALSILIGGLLLDMFVTLSLGVSALPVNIVIGALVLLGLGTAVRLGVRCHSQWSMRSIMQRRDLTSDPSPSSS